MREWDKKEKEKEMGKGECVWEKGKELRGKGGEKVKLYGMGGVVWVVWGGLMWFMLKGERRERVEGRGGMNRRIGEGMGGERMREKEKG